MAENRFPKSARLLRSSDFDRVFASRASAADAGLVLYGLENEFGHPRLGLAASRRYGPATTRNRWKRVVREAFRLLQHELPPLDLVCLPRGPEEAKLGRTQASLRELSRQIARKLRKRRRESTELRPADEKRP
jgi:ribonuclease P protein component